MRRGGERVQELGNNGATLLYNVTIFSSTENLLN